MRISISVTEAREYIFGQNVLMLMCLYFKPFASA